LYSKRPKRLGSFLSPRRDTFGKSTFAIHRQRLLATCFLVVASAIFAAAQSAETDTALLSELKKNSHALSIGEGQLSGEGAEFLTAEAGRAQFCLVGEEHGFAENSIFAAALLRRIHQVGYKYFASEIGKLTTGRLEPAARQTNVREVFAEFNQRYPFSLPFFNWREEADLLTVALGPPRGKLPTWWGIDQEFFFSPIYHFERLRQLAKTPDSQKVVGEYYEKVRTELARSREAHNPQSAFIVSAKPDDFKNLEAAFSDKDTEAREIVRALQESWQIYQKNFRGEQYVNNLQRSRLLKRNFMSYYDEAHKLEKQPHVFFKFGAAHIFRGRNYVNVFDLGNMASELAESQGATSFHILVLAADGTYNKYIPFIGNEADKTKKLDAQSVYSYLDVKPFVTLAESADWQVIDLRPLRPLLGTKQLSQVPRGFTEVICGFDAVVVVKQAHPSSLF